MCRKPSCQSQGLKALPRQSQPPKCKLTPSAKGGGGEIAGWSLTELRSGDRQMFILEDVDLHFGGWNCLGLAFSERGTPKKRGFPQHNWRLKNQDCPLGSKFSKQNESFNREWKFPASHAARPLFWRILKVEIEVFQRECHFEGKTTFHSKSTASQTFNQDFFFSAFGVMGLFQAVLNSVSAEHQMQQRLHRWGLGHESTLQKEPLAQMYGRF